MVLGAIVAVWQARSAVNKEVESSINLAMQLIKLGLSGQSDLAVDETDWIYRLNALQETRHLTIQLYDENGTLMDIGSVRQQGDTEELPPHWFSSLVSSGYPQVHHQFTTKDQNDLTLTIDANPMDEITEIWHETIVFFVTICSLVLLTMLAVHLVLNKTLHSISTIVDTLQLIETGEYQQKLSQFQVQEYDSIASAINHMTGVLESTRKQNKALTQHSLLIQEEERQRLSQELHDELGQSLTAIKVMAVTAKNQQADTPKIMQSISEICDHLVTVVRSMMQQLHPLMLEELGLKATLQDLVQHWQDRNPELSVHIHCDDAANTLNAPTSIQVFRVIQECFTNINRHAQANKVKVHLRPHPQYAEKLRVTVEDNGIGCNIKHIASGFGLLSMRERIKSLDGDFAIFSAPGAGMRVDFSVKMA